MDRSRKGKGKAIEESYSATQAKDTAKTLLGSGYDKGILDIKVGSGLGHTLIPDISHLVSGSDPTYDLLVKEETKKKEKEDTEFNQAIKLSEQEIPWHADAVAQWVKGVDQQVIKDANWAADVERNIRGEGTADKEEDKFEDYGDSDYSQDDED